jgi:leucine dehydrogenase
MWTYPHWSDAVGDALRLSAAMTLKNAAAGLDAGGGKSVICLPPGTTLDADRRRAAYLDLGDAVDRFDGSYRTAEDVGSTTEDMLVVSERTAHVVGLPDAVGGSGEPAGPTSLGVYEALRATLEQVTGSPEVAGRRITISGLGQVGSRLAVRLSAEGAALTVTDVNPAKRDLAAELGARWVEPGSEHLVEADVFVPAGIGGVLDADTIDALAARAVCGPANNPLAHRSGADRLAARGILYAPDFVVNAGGVVYLDLEAKHRGTRSDHGSCRRDRRHRARDLRRCRRADITPLDAAEERAAERLAVGRRARAAPCSSDAGGRHAVSRNGDRVPHTRRRWHDGRTRQRRRSARAFAARRRRRPPCSPAPSPMSRSRTSASTTTCSPISARTTPRASPSSIRPRAPRRPTARSRRRSTPSPARWRRAASAPTPCSVCSARTCPRSPPSSTASSAPARR